MSNERVIRRLTVLKEEADKEPTPQRKFFHIGQPELVEDLGECVPMIAWITDNLSRFVVADGPSSSWGRVAAPTTIIALPNHAVTAGDGLFLVTGPGESSKIPHPSGKGSMHFIHLGLSRRLWDKGASRIYLYRLEGVQFKALAEKKA